MRGDRVTCPTDDQHRDADARQLSPQGIAQSILQRPPGAVGSSEPIIHQRQQWLRGCLAGRIHQQSPELSEGGTRRRIHRRADKRRASDQFGMAQGQRGDHLAAERIADKDRVASPVRAQLPSQRIGQSVDVPARAEACRCARSPAGPGRRLDSHTRAIARWGSCSDRRRQGRGPAQPAVLAGPGRPRRARAGAPRPPSPGCSPACFALGGSSERGEIASHRPDVAGTPGDHEDVPEGVRAEDART